MWWQRIANKFCIKLLFQGAFLLPMMELIHIAGGPQIAIQDRACTL
jgi:hypothetical protein